MADPVLFKVFLSSPGDVPQERDDAQAVIDEVNASGEFSHHFILKLYRWDDRAVVLPMPVTEIPQKSVDMYMIRPSACDLTVVLFWSRMGSPLVMDEREYLSGTHYEYSEAIQGYKQIGKPTVWLYHCAEEPSIKLTDLNRDEKIKQFDSVIQFFKQFRDAEGRPIGGVNDYPAHADFKALFKQQLVTYLRYLRDYPRESNEPELIHASNPNVIPYRGLSALDESDAPIFFGRSAEGMEVLTRIDKQRLVFVLGASGSGKSSLVAAGVLPKLRVQGWKIVRCVPGNDPFFNMALALRLAPVDTGAKLQAYLKTARELALQLRADPKALVAMLENTAEKRILLFIDQFEEIFTLADKNPALAPGSIEAFIRAIRLPSSRVVTLLTMRADFYGAALPHFDELKRHAYGLTRPSPFALYEMITRPAELAGLTLDEGLAKQIIDDAGSESGALALISYVLESLYLQAKMRGDGRLSRYDYEMELQGVRGAINTLAERAYDELPFDDTARQKALQAVFRELIALTEEDGQLIPTRRRSTILAQLPDDCNEAQLIRHFVQARLLVADSNSVEVAHEAILRFWDALADWIMAVKGDLALFRQYERDATTWDERGRIGPLPGHEALMYFERACANLGYVRDRLPEPLKSYTEPEQDRLLQELDILPRDDTSHERRRDIGDRLAVIGDPRPGVGVRDGLPDILWQPIEIPSEPITIKTHSRDIGPITITPFFLSTYLVTYAQYQAFATSPDGYKNRLWWQEFLEIYRPQRLRNGRAKLFNSPRDSVSWYQCVAFARWMTYRLRGYELRHPSGLLLRVGQNAEIRLPLEWEWQWTAQGGSERREYPWGAWQAGYANTEEAGLSRPTAVGMYPHGASVFGALDLAGNLWEWCHNNHEKYFIINGFRSGTSKVLRGGSFRDVRSLSATAMLSYNYPDYDYHNFGFRLVCGVPVASLASGTLRSENE